MPHYCSKDNPKYTIKDWMSRVENKLLTQLTIPGTHDSACRVSLAAAKTQTYSIKDQLEAGIRFLDIRCRHVENIFAIHHGAMYCGLMFGDVIQICRNFLKANPKEVIIMRVKEEYNPENCTRKFVDTFTNYWNKNKDVMTMTRYIPMLDDVRGKVYIIPNFVYWDGYDWARSEIQDEVDVPTVFDIEKKCKKVEDFLEKTKNGNIYNFYINFCSGFGYGCWPYTVADDTNKVPMKHKGRLGIVVMDFPGEDAIRHLADQNFPTI
jgi:1-phosphatidylinositol phosphodiesterase